MELNDTVTVSYNSSHGDYSFAPKEAEAALAALTGPVDFGAWSHAVCVACRAGRPITLGDLAASITDANGRLVTARAKKGIRRVRCDCGHECESHLVMSASLGTACPECYDRMSN